MILKNNFLKHNWPIISILILALSLRFFDYFSRINVSTDQGRDALLTLEAIKNHKLPLLGPPSSAWAFNFGPLYYYFIIFFTLIIPHSFGPWIGFTSLSVLSVWLFYRNDKIGLYLALVAAISFGEIANSLNMLNTALVSFSTVLSFYALDKILKKKSVVYSLLLGFSVALAINSHMQSLSLVTLIPLSLIFSASKIKDRILSLFFQVIGFVVAFIPLLYFESMHYFAWTKSILDYAINGQNKFYTPVRWITEFTQFWPSIFGNVIFGIPILGYALIFLTFSAALISILKKYKPSPLFLCVFITFIVEIISVRYYKGPRSSEYFIVAIPFVIYFTAWTISVFAKLNKLLGILLLVLLVGINLVNINMVMKSNSHAPEVIELYRQITSKYPQKINLLAFSWSDEAARTLYYILKKNDKISEDSPNTLAICYLRDSEGKPVEFCPKHSREIRSGKFIIYEYINLKKSEIDEFQVASISAEILYKRNYNNYELIKY